MRNFNFLVFGNVWESAKVGAGPYLSPHFQLHCVRLWTNGCIFSFCCIILSNFSPLEECCIQSVCYNLYVIRNSYCLIATCSMTRPTFCIPKLHLGIEHMFLLCVIHITYRCERKGRRRKLGNDVVFIDEQQ